MKLIALTAAISALFCACSWAADAPVLPQAIKDKGFIAAGIMPNYPPMDFKDPATNQLTGVDYDLGMEMSKRLGIEFRWQETAFEQMVSGLATNRIDIVLSGMTDTAERQKTVDFVDYFSTGPQFYTLETQKELKAASDLCGKKVGTSRRTTFPVEIAKWSEQNCEAKGKPAITVVGTEGSADARAQLRQARLDAAVQGSETLPYIQSQEPGVFKIIGEPLARQLTGLGVAKTNTPLSAAIAATLDTMIKDGSYQKILKKWDQEDGAVAQAQINGAK
ncbi:ABC transporter substrate-binding protein [Pseudomonas sp. LP_7_YM]|uniref:ABC transporter substrate-binding protein n=1 Tax=Pseudomonas sp. LP_7_YM TaxID=2485137 RepID=UPI0010D1E5D0|nr:amino acid ABC transporter substrate-binding protein (PAAT family) [Pseudomonas sp. LP_7_YM]